MRATETERDTKALRRAENNIGSERARRDNQIEGEKVARDDNNTADALYRGDVRRDVADASAGTGVLNQRTECAVHHGFCCAATREVDIPERHADGRGASFENRARLREGVRVNEENL